MSETETQEPTEPQVTDVPEPDQEPHEPIPDEADDDEEAAEDEDQSAPDQPPETPEAQGTSPQEWEKRWKAADKAFATYTNRVSAIFEDDAVDFLPVSISPSAPPGFIYRHDAGRVPDEVQAPILEFFGLAREQDYEPDPFTETCPTCKGKTKTKTGSSDPQFATRPCPTCKAWGYTINGRAPSDEQANGNGEVLDAEEKVGPLVTEERDVWGDPKILPDGRPNPNYGKMPQYKERIAPWGVTAELTAQDAAV